jgi:nucleotide-binding universal stress UspA family protein
MVLSTTHGIAAPPGLAAEPVRFLPRPVEVGQVLVPLDGSPFSERALPVATWLATGLGGHTHLVEVVPCDASAESDAAIRYLDRIARAHHAAVWDVLERDEVGMALADTVAANPHRLACLATNGRGRSIPLGSVSVFLLEHSRWPVVLVGPHARVVKASDAPIVVAVDGSTRDDVLVPVALGWAARLRRPLVVVTVAEPVPAGFRGPGDVHRARGPAEPERYVESLVARTEGAGVAVSGRAIYDPVSVRDSLVPFLDRTTALVVVGSHHRPGLGRMVLGSHAVRIVHDAAVPVLVVPLG